MANKWGGRFKDISGQKFGRLSVIEPARDKNGEALKQGYSVVWACKCDCGNPNIKKIRGDRIKAGKAKSCGACSVYETIGKKFGSLFVVSHSHTENYYNYFNCKCDCGNPNIITANSKKLKSGSCGKCCRHKTIGKKFTHLFVIGRSRDNNGKILKQGTNTLYNCKCDCGNSNIIIVQGRNLRNGTSKSCGECNKHTMIGRAFGRYLVLSFSHAEGGKRYFNCKCNCGNPNVKPVRGDLLRSGSPKSCGSCCIYEIENKKFGFLTAVKLAVDNNGNVLKSGNNNVWKCKCDCGNYTLVNKTNLTSGHSKSCGCASKISETELANVFKSIFCNEPIKQDCKFFWLKNEKTGFLFRVDIYFPKLKLAVERDGEQHFRPVCFGGISYKEAYDKMAYAQHNDHIKNQLIAQHIKGSGKDIKYFIRIRYDEPHTEEYIREKLKKLGIIA